jgi:hypothetical protein
MTSATGPADQMTSATGPSTTDPILDNSVDQLVASINTMVGNEQITSFNILSICMSLMQIVEKYPNLQGHQKKELVLRALDVALSKKGGNNALMALIPSFIDNVISIDNDQVKISIDPAAVAGCLTGIASCLTKSCAKK